MSHLINIEDMEDIRLQTVGELEKINETFFNDSQTLENNFSSNAEISTHKSIELSAELRKKLNDLPDVIQYIEKLQKIIQKQVKKIVKWKMKAKQLCEKHCEDATTQTIFDEVTLVNNVNLLEELPGESKGEEEKSLTENIREAAEEAMQSSGFVYEETSGLYYDYNSGYYYNAEYGLYYDGTTGTYLKYNQDTQTYEFHSQVSASETKSPTKIDSEQNSKRRSKKENTSKVNSFYNMETLSSSFSNMNINNLRTIASDVCKKYPPCMRMIVESTEIPKIKMGSLFIITCDGGTIGREGNHSVLLPDVNVSKHHLKVTYNLELSQYMIIDLGSRNGTILNGKRISASKQESEPVEVPHGSKLQMGSTILLCHIHEGSQTCGHCEPGLLIEEEKDPPVPTSKNKKSINQQYKAELRRLRKQHGFLGSTEVNTNVATGYTDRAQHRRQTVGSQNPYEKTQAASLEEKYIKKRKEEGPEVQQLVQALQETQQPEIESIPSENKGFKLLSKMGWKEGQSLGKDGTGTLDPIKPKLNVGNSGVGSEQPAPVIVNENKKNIWKKTQERFDKLPEKKIFDDDSDS